MIRNCTRIALFLIIAAVFVPIGLAEDSSQKKALEVAQNRLASVKNRLSAIEELKTNEDSETVTALIKIVRDQEDSIIVRGHVIELLVTMNEFSVPMELKRLLHDKFLSPEVRKFALYAYWKKDPQNAMSELINIAQDQSDPVDLRVAALAYLGKTQGKYPAGFWKNIFVRKENPAPLRIAAISGMEALDILYDEQAALLQVLQNPNESIEIRKSIILTAGRILSMSEFQTEMITLISQPNNPAEIRRFAVDNLGAQTDETILPELKTLAAREKDRIVLEQLNALINNISSK